MPQRMKILLSDHDEGFSMLLQEALHEYGPFRVFHAKNAQESVDAIFQHKPDVLVLDHGLPLEGAFHFMEQLHKSGYTFSIILMTTLQTREVVVEALSRGASFVIPKPFTIKALVNCIHDTLVQDSSR